MKKNVIPCIGCPLYDPDFGCTAEYEWDCPQSDVFHLLNMRCPVMADAPEAKSLRFLAVTFPYIENPKDDYERLSNAIHVYSSRGAECIDRLHSEVISLRSQLEVHGDG